MNSPFQDSWLNSDNLRLYLETPESELIRNVNPRAQQTVITAKRGNQSPPPESKQIIVKSSGGLAIELPKLALNQLNHDKLLLPSTTSNEETINKKNRLDFTSSVRNFHLHSPLSQSYTSLKQHGSAALEGPLSRPLESPLYIPLQQPQQFQSPQQISSYAKWNSPRSLSPSYLQYQRQQQQQTSQSQREAQEQANATREAFMRRKFSNTMKNTFCLRNKIRSGGSYRDFGLTSEPSVNTLHRTQNQHQQHQIQQQQQNLDQQKSSLGGIQVKSVLPKREKLLPSSAPKKFVIPAKGTGPPKQLTSQYPPMSKYEKILSLMSKDNNSRFVSNEDNSNLNSNDRANDVNSTNAYFSLFGVSSRAIFNKEQLLSSQRSAHRQLELPSKTQAASPDVYSNFNTPTMFNTNDQENLQRETQTQFQLLSQSPAAPGIVLSTSQLTLEPPRPPFKPSHIIQNNSQSSKQIIIYNNTNLSNLIASHDDAAKILSGKNNTTNFPNKVSFNSSETTNNFGLNNEAYKTISLEKKNRIQSDIQLLQQQRLLQGYDFSKKMRNTLSMHQLPNPYPSKKEKSQKDNGKNGSNSNSSSNNQQFLEVVGKSKGIKPQSQIDDFMGIFQMNKNMMQSQLQQEAEQVKKLDRIVEEKDKRQQQIEQAREVEREIKRSMEREQQLLKEKQLIKQGQIEQFKERQMKRESQRIGMLKQNEEKNKAKVKKDEQGPGGRGSEKETIEGDKRNDDSSKEEGRQMLSQQRESDVLQKETQQKGGVAGQGNEQQVGIETGQRISSSEEKEDERNSGNVPGMQSSRDKGRMKFSRVDSKGNIIAGNNTGGVDELEKMKQLSQREIQQEQQQQQKSERLVQGQLQQQSVSEAEIPRWAMQEPDKLEKLAEANEKLAGTGADGKSNGIKEQGEEEYADEEQINVLSDIHKVIQTQHNEEGMEITNGAKLLEEKGIVSYVQRASMEGDTAKIASVKEDAIKHGEEGNNGQDSAAAVGISRAVVLDQKHEDVQKEQHQQYPSITVINPPPTALPSMAQAGQVIIPQNNTNIQDKPINSSGNITQEQLKAQEPADGIISINILPMDQAKEHNNLAGQVESLPQPIILIIPAVEETKQKSVEADKAIEAKNNSGVMLKQGQDDKNEASLKEGEQQGDKVQKIGDSQVKDIAIGDKMKESNSRMQKEDQNNGKQIGQSELPQLQQQQSSQKLQQQSQQQPQKPPTPQSSPPSSSLELSQQQSQPIQQISISVSQAQDTEPSAFVGQQDNDDNDEEGGFVMKKVIDFDSLKVLRDKTINRLSVQTSQQKKQQFVSNNNSNPGSAQLPSKVQSNAKQLTIQTSQQQSQQSSSRSIAVSPNKSKMSSNNANSSTSNGGMNQNSSSSNQNTQNNTNSNNNNNNSSAGNINNIAKTPMKQQQQQPGKKAIISPTAAATAAAAAQSGSSSTNATNKFAKKNNKSKPKRKEEEQPVVVVEEISEEQKRQEKQREQDLLIAQKLEEVRDKVKQGVKSVIKDQIAKKIQQAQKLNAKQKELDGDATGEDGQSSSGNNNGSGQNIPSVAEYHSAVMELYSACIDDLRETASSSNNGSANSFSNNNFNSNQENTKPDGHDFELRGMRHFDAGMSASIGKALETELRKTEMNEAEVERFRYIYEINTKVHVLYSGMVKMLGGADKVRKLITAVLRRVSSHLPMLPIGFEWSYEVIHRRIIPGICALLCDDQQLFLRNLRQFSKTQEFTFIDFYFAKRETFSLLTGNKIKKIFPELSQELSLGVIQKIESVRRYMFPVKVLADGEIRDTIVKGLMSCEQFVELFAPNKLTNKFLSNLLMQLFDYFYSDVESDSAPKPPKIRAICQPLLAQTLSRKLLDYIEAFTLRALQNDRFTLNLILRDLHYKFTKVRLRLGFKQGIFGHFDTFEDIDGLIEQLELEVRAAIHYGAADFFPESQRAKLTDMKFLKYYLKFLLAEHDIFSVFDFAVAMPYDGVLHSHFLFWMNCLRAVILTKYDFQPAQAHVFIRFLEACCPAS